MILRPFFLAAASGLTIILGTPSGMAQVSEPVRLDRPFSCTIPASQRKQEEGCYILAAEVLTSLPEAPLFWHLYTYPTIQAATLAKGTSAGTVVKALGKAWFFNIAAKDWRPRGGERVAVVGPLPRFPAKTYVARYMEDVSSLPMERTPVHRHPGVEAWFLLGGSQCMQTPGKTSVIHSGETAFVPAGVPMQLTNTGTETRRSIVLVLHNAALLWRARVSDWKPNAACPN